MSQDLYLNLYRRGNITSHIKLVTVTQVISIFVGEGSLYHCRRSCKSETLVGRDNARDLYSNGTIIYKAIFIENFVSMTKNRSP